jgi:hypothetical protein
VDGAVPADGVLPSPDLPVSVQVGGRPAYVLYAGAAPGTIEGVFQINVRIPTLAPTGPNIMVVLQVGDAVSQTGAWIAIGSAPNLIAKARTMGKVPVIARTRVAAGRSPGDHTSRPKR